MHGIRWFKALAKMAGPASDSLSLSGLLSPSAIGYGCSFWRWGDQDTTELTPSLKLLPKSQIPHLHLLLSLFEQTYQHMCLFGT